ncbi:hypothetical protein GOP47_0001692, partial [Adiantum capillus-veneris]
ILSTCYVISLSFETQNTQLIHSRLCSVGLRSQTVDCKMKSPARGLPRHMTGKGTMFELELQDQTPLPNEQATRSSPSKVEVNAVPGGMHCIQLEALNKVIQ